MGVWNESITGNDLAQDMKYEYRAAFSCNDVETALEKLDAYARREFGGADEEWCDYVYSLADFMWKHGILTEEIRDRAIDLIDGGFSLELWQEAGILRKRRKVLTRFRETLLSPQPPKKNITVKLYTKPIFEIGDVVAIQLFTSDRHYIPGSKFSEAEFRSMDRQYVVMRKVADHISYASQAEPTVRDIWPVFQLYGKAFAHCPTMEELHGVPWADPSWKDREGYCPSYPDGDIPYDGAFYCEGSMFYFRRRGHRVLGRDLENLPEKRYVTASIFLTSNYGRTNCETEFLNAIAASKG